MNVKMPFSTCSFCFEIIITKRTILMKSQKASHGRTGEKTEDDGFSLVCKKKT